LTHLGGRVLEVRSGVGGAQGSAARCSGDMTGGRRRVACEQGRGESGCRVDPDVGEVADKRASWQWGTGADTQARHREAEIG
jgi:hypothetical protein